MIIWVEDFTNQCAFSASVKAQVPKVSLSSASFPRANCLQMLPMHLCEQQPTTGDHISNEMGGVAGKMRVEENKLKKSFFVCNLGEGILAT
jgi:hypothetical protein